VVDHVDAAKPRWNTLRLVVALKPKYNTVAI
jgi:hypothetical protein